MAGWLSRSELEERMVALGITKDDDPILKVGVLDDTISVIGLDKVVEVALIVGTESSANNWVVSF